MHFPDNSVFYFFKRTDNSSYLGCSVIMMPLHVQNSCGYTFTVTANMGNETVTATEENVTADRVLAERMFNFICENSTQPQDLAKVAAKFKSTL